MLHIRGGTTVLVLLMNFFFQTLFLSFNFDGLIYCARWNWFGAGSVAFWAAFWWAPRTAGERRLVKSAIFEVLNGCRGFIFGEGHTKIAVFNVEHFLRWLILVLEFNWRWAMQIEFNFWIQKLSIKLIQNCVFLPQFKTGFQSFIVYLRNSNFILETTCRGPDIPSKHVTPVGAVRCCPGTSCIRQGVWERQTQTKRKRSEYITSHAPHIYLYAFRAHDDVNFGHGKWLTVRGWVRKSSPRPNVIGPPSALGGLPLRGLADGCVGNTWLSSGGCIKTDDITCPYWFVMLGFAGSRWGEAYLSMLGFAYRFSGR